MTKQTNGINDTYSSNSTDTSGFGSKDIRDIDESTMNLYLADKLSDDEIACKYGDESAIQVFRTACVYGQIEVVENLLNRGFDPNIFMQYGGKNSAVTIACDQGHYELARLLLKSGVKASAVVWNEITNCLEVNVINSNTIENSDINCSGENDLLDRQYDALDLDL